MLTQIPRKTMTFKHNTTSNHLDFEDKSQTDFSKGLVTEETKISWSEQLRSTVAFCALKMGYLKLIQFFEIESNSLIGVF